MRGSTRVHDAVHKFFAQLWSGEGAWGAAHAYAYMYKESERGATPPVFYVMTQ